MLEAVAVLMVCILMMILHHKDLREKGIKTKHIDKLVQEEEVHELAKKHPKVQELSTDPRIKELAKRFQQGSGLLTIDWKWMDNKGRIDIDKILQDENVASLIKETALQQLVQDPDIVDMAKTLLKDGIIPD